MKDIFKEIVKLSAHMQDLRDDDGHAETVTEMAVKLCHELKCNEDILFLQQFCTIQDILE